MSIVTGKMQPDEGKVEWSKYVTAGYLDQHSVLEEGQTVRDSLRTALMSCSQLKLASMTSIWPWRKREPDVDALMEEVGELQERLESRDFYTWMPRSMKWRVLLGVMDFGMDTDVTPYQVGNGPRSFRKLLLEKPDILLLGRADQLLGCRAYRLAQTLLAEL